MSSEKITGSCLCGAIKFEAAPPFAAFRYCHCSRCQKASGSAHAANLFVPEAQFKWTAGEAQLKRFPLPKAERFSVWFCPECGTRMPHKVNGTENMLVPAGVLDADPGDPERLGDPSERARFVGQDEGDHRLHRVGEAEPVEDPLGPLHRVGERAGFDMGLEALRVHRARRRHVGGVDPDLGGTIGGEQVKVGTCVLANGCLRLNRRLDAVSKRSHAYPFVAVAPPLGSIHVVDG